MSHTRLIALFCGLSSCQIIVPRGGIFLCDQGTCEDGLTCCADGYCRATCVDEPPACTPGVTCEGNPGAPCRLGVTSCPEEGPATCVDGPTAPNGLACGEDQVCVDGSCAVCQEGSPCASNPTACRAGAQRCGAAPSCEDSERALPVGGSCGLDKVCDAMGSCNPCAADAGCATPPSVCREGRVDCSTGSPLCNDGPLHSAGTACGEGLVCDSVGSCATCVEGEPCATNPDPCRDGLFTCSSSPAGCIDAAQKAVGAACGTDRVCTAAGACVACTAMQLCTTNPTPCLVGATACDTGSQVCIDTATPMPAGTSCGTDLVCSAAGTCVACSEGSACTGNPNPCKQGVTDCSSGASVCVDGTQNAPNGSQCGAGQTCNGGVCGTCSAGQPCTGNPTACRLGVYNCSGATPACVDGTGNRPAGASCGTNLVCNSSGACVACTAGGSCSTNPNRCKAGVISCATGSSACVDSTTNLPLGTLCTGGFCNAGACVACALGSACTTNSGAPCRAGVLARSGSSCVCSDGPATNNGQTCGTSTYGAWSACTYAAACSNTGSRTRTRTDRLCSNGTCGTATATETDTIGCNRNQENQPCNAGYVCGAWSGCAYSSECDKTATMTRGCINNRCVSGSCVGSPVTETDTTSCNRETDWANCSGGRCISGGCCGGCIAGDSCHPGTSDDACGGRGIGCFSCASGACDPGGNDCMP